MHMLFFYPECSDWFHTPLLPFYNHPPKKNPEALREMAALPPQDWRAWPGKWTLTEGLNAFLQQLVFTAAAFIQHAQSHGSHDLADFPGAGARLVAPGLSGPAPPPCLSWAFLVRLPVGTPPPRESWEPLPLGRPPEFFLTPKSQVIMGENPWRIPNHGSLLLQVNSKGYSCPFRESGEKTLKITLNPQEIMEKKTPGLLRNLQGIIRKPLLPGIDPKFPLTV